MRKKGLLIFLLVIMFFLGINSLNAATLNIKSGNSTYVVDETKESNKVYNKVLDEKVTYCISGFEKVPKNGATCTLNNKLLEEEERRVIGQIITNVCSGNCSFGENYALTEVAIFEYLQHRGYSVESTGKTSVQSDAQEVYQTALNTVTNNSLEAVSLDKSSLKFTIKNGYYESETVKVTNSGKFSTVDFSATGATGIEYSYPTSNSVVIKIPVKNVTKVTNISLTATGAKEYPEVNLYECTNDSQNVALLTSSTKTKTASISGSITPLGKLTINKYDGNNKHLAGATIKVTGTKGYSKTFKTEGKAIVIDNLEYDTYTIEETVVPDGYVKSEKKTATLTNTNYQATVNLVNTKIKTTFSKLDATGKSELPGAFLEIQDEDGKVVKLCPGTEEENYIMCTWISTDKPYVIEGLPVGKYYLVETIAPDRYVLSKEKVMFEITGNENDVKVEMKNSLNKIRISKISLVDKQELPGATLEIQDKAGKVVEFCTDANGEKNKPCKWVSTDKPYEIEGMPNGTYYLIETLAPKGYVLSKEKIEFKVDGNEAIVEVEMKNELEVKVPDTLSSRSVLLIAISMFDIALGIGIITYVKKNKIEE